jgi:hypothetical protein
MAELPLLFEPIEQELANHQARDANSSLHPAVVVVWGLRSGS